MASYTKTFDLIAKDFSGNIIKTNTVIIEPNYTGYFYFGEGDIPFLKTLKKVEINVYCKSGSGQVIDFEFQFNLFRGFVNVEHSISTGWNKVEISYSGALWDEDDDSPLIEISPDYDGRNVEIYTHNSEYKPYVTITYEDSPPRKPTSLYPANTTVNARNETRFSWVHNSREKTPQKGFVLEYSVDYGATWITISRTTSYPYYDMPANKLPLTEEIMWRVKTIDTNGLESEFSNAEFITELVPQKAPILISPISNYLDGKKPIVFRWNFVGGTAEDKQGKYDLQYSLNQGTSWVTITNSSNQEEHIIPENTFRSGNIYWRVRTYNTHGDVSPYSEIGSFYVINSPPMPQIKSVTNNSKPIITWISTEQYLYEIQIVKNEEVVIDSGIIPSISDRSYKINEFLADGNYKARIRVVNQYSLYSDWAEFSFAISTVKPDKPNLTIYNGEYSVTLEVNDTGLKTLVYRDNKLIGEVMDNRFTDFTGENNKEYAYFIRVVDENDNFNDSDIELGKCSFKGNTIAVADNPEDYVILKYGLGDIPGKSNRNTNQGILTYFDGRKYPVVEFSEHRDKEKSLSFFIKDLDKLNKLIGLIDKKEILLYRDISGENIYGTVLSIDYAKSLLGYEVSFTINKTDYEGVSYD